MTPTFLASLAPPAPTAYHRLNPLTKAVAATVESLGAFALGGFLGPLAIIGLRSCRPPSSPASRAGSSGSRSC